MSVNIFLLPIVGGVAFAAMKPGQVSQDIGRFDWCCGLVYSVCSDKVSGVGSMSERNGKSENTLDGNKNKLQVRVRLTSSAC